MSGSQQLFLNKYYYSSTLNLKDTGIRDAWESRREKHYVAWINAILSSSSSSEEKGTVSDLCTDLRDGLVILQICDVIKPNAVQWKKVVKNFSTKSPSKMYCEKIANCMYSLEIAKSIGNVFSFNYLSILKGDRKTILALVWQLMRAYDLSVLTRIKTRRGNGSKGGLLSEADIIQWTNEQLKSAGKSTELKSLSDSSLSNALLILDLIDAIRPPSSTPPHEEQPIRDDNMSNAKLALSEARKLGAKVYALPEDIVEVRSKMIVTLIVALMDIKLNAV